MGIGGIETYILLREKRIISFVGSPFLWLSVIGYRLSVISSKLLEEGGESAFDHKREES